jgi:AcrR family transcriptional regulator
MATRTERTPRQRDPLTQERVMIAAVGLADRDGIEALTMRNLAHELGVEAMSLYYHVENKEAVLDGVAEVILGEIESAVSRIEPPTEPDQWKTAMRMRILSARDVLLRHRWASGVLESRTRISPTTMVYFDELLGLFRFGGFSYDLAHHALHTLGSRAIGFSQELFELGNQDDGGGDVDLEQMADQFPYLVGMMAEIAHDDPDSTIGWCDDQTEFEFGLDLILNGLDRLRS